MADPEGVIALDARIVVEHPAPHAGRYGHVAIHPYPAHLETRFQLTDGSDISIRPIRPEDAEIEQQFIRNLSPESKYFRFMRSLTELTLDMLVRFTQIDYDREMAFIAVRDTKEGEEELGVGRYVVNPDGQTCEFALVVADDWRRKGLGARILTALIESARTKGLRALGGEILANNEPMLGMVKRLGFTVRTSPEDPQIKLATIPL
jgi:acetyltransferase